jgi:DNA processing protein
VARDVTDSSLAALLLTNRIVDVGAKPLSAAEFWAWHRAAAAADGAATADGAVPEDQPDQPDQPDELAERIAVLLGAGTAFAFERERLAEEGIRLVSALDAAFPARLRDRLADACPAFLLVAGPIEHLAAQTMGVVGSRNAPAAALAVAEAAARAAATAGRAVVSGLARGIDQAAMTAALDAGAAVVGFPPEGIRVVARSADVRRRVHAGELCLASPYGPSTRFAAGNALGRNKLIYGHADITLVVCSDLESGGTWAGAREAQRRRFGRVAVWMGAGAGLGNAALAEAGAASLTDLDDLLTSRDTAAPPEQSSLFE